MLFRRRIRPQRRARGCIVDLPPEERQLLEMLPAELAKVLGQLERDDPLPPALQRLFPRAYVTDEEAEKAYQSSTRGELTARHVEALEALSRSARAKSLTEEEMGEWLSAITDLRLVLGSVLDVTDSEEMVPGDKTNSELVIYHYLSMLQSELIDVLEQWLPEPVPGADDLVPDDPWGEPLGGLRWDGTPLPNWPPRPSW